MSQLLPDNISLFMRWLFSFAMLGVRYLIFAGAAYLIFYAIKKQDWLFMKIQPKYPQKKQIWTEVGYSILTFCVFASVILLIRLAVTHGLFETKVYKHLSDHGIPYYIATTVFIILFHDTYFYWMHRLMHHPFFYQRIHAVHHLSKDPTPWAAFSFHPSEAVLEILFVPFLIFTIPLHFSSLLILSLWQIGFNVMGHLGFELFPQGAIKHPLLKWLNTSTNHNMHHKYVRCNYGLYFSFWDRIMNTNHDKYHQTFDEVTARRDEGIKKLRSRGAVLSPELENA